MAIPEIEIIKRIEGNRVYPWAAEAVMPPRCPVVRLHHEAFVGAVDPETADSDNSDRSYPGGRAVLSSRKLSTFGEAVCYLHCVMLFELTYYRRLDPDQ